MHKRMIFLKIKSKNLFSFFIFLTIFSIFQKSAFGVQISGCVEGDLNIVSQQRDVNSFEHIVVDGAFKVFLENLENTEQEKIVIEAEKNIANQISTEVKNQILTIKPTVSICPSKDMNVFIKIKKVNKLDFFGANNIVLNGVNLSNLKIKLDGANEILASGKVTNLELYTNGSSVADFTKLHTQNSVILANGVSDIKIFVSQLLDIRSDGVSKIVYYGNPKKIEKIDNAILELQDGSQIK